MATSALQLISEAIDALMRADAARLERLAGASCAAQAPHTEPELQSVAVKRRVLANLLRLTRHNLRVLRRLSPESREYTENGR